MTPRREPAAQLSGRSNFASRLTMRLQSADEASVWNRLGVSTRPSVPQIAS
jgi:hypothetical protein